MSWDVADFFGCGQIPPVNRPVLASRDQDFLIGRQSDRLAPNLVALEMPNRLAGSNIPFVNQPVRSPGKKRFAVSEQLQKLNEIEVSFRLIKRRAGFHVP